MATGGRLHFPGPRQSVQPGAGTVGHVLTRTDVKHVLGTIDQSAPLGRRNVALLQFLNNKGARAQELVTVRLRAAWTHRSKAGSSVLINRSRTPSLVRT